MTGFDYGVVFFATLAISFSTRFFFQKRKSIVVDLGKHKWIIKIKK